MAVTDVLVAVIFAGRLVQNGLVPVVPSAMLVAGVSARTPTAATPTADAIRVLETRFIVCPSYVRLRGVGALCVLLCLCVGTAIYLRFVLSITLRQLQHMCTSACGSCRRSARSACRCACAVLPHVCAYCTSGN